MTPVGPDFLLIGAPKCGTTAMADFLGQHPEIGMCPHKESHHFATDLYPRMWVKPGARPPTRDEYLGYFEGLEGRRRRGEASVWYLYSSTAAREIKEFCPEADILVMLRNPVEMLPSLHSQFVFVGLEPEPDFERALALDDERERAGTPPGFPPRSYRSAVRYGEQLRRYLDLFGRERVHAIVYDRFRDDTAGAFRDTCAVLGVDSSFSPAFEVVNPNKRPRSRAMSRLIGRPPQPFRRMMHAVSSQEWRRRGGAVLRRWNTRFEERPPVAPAVIEPLRPLIAEQVGELRALLGIDLDAWLD
ncbi:MAG: sulfotransferase [Solirubrobacterales bacterium]